MSGPKNNRVAVTGAAGFIGSNLVDQLVKEKFSIIGIDDLSTGIIERGDGKRFPKETDYVFEKLDINDDVDRLHQLFSGIDTVFHLAALARVPYSIKYPLETNKTNVTGTLNVLEAARRAGVRRVIFSCSSSIFGETTNFPTQETCPTRPLSPYALQKITGAEYCRLYSELYEIDTISLVYYNVFGPYQRADSAYGMAIPRFFAAATKGGECRIDGDGEQNRDFCFISNVVDALILAAQSERRFNGDLINVASGEYHTINEVYNQVRRIVNRPLRKIHASPRPGDPRKSHADISKARIILGYEPKISFEEGMKITGKWWVENQPT